ncbi:uncharacterized protein BcabD6B2_53900 [Babesia caballi]|uniref:Uncharacterized protein n=1 Tax=Babesia caballi TaxID=5871 RepID=A0AAV4M546_BABCB|nr:hypothetical protein BcabD6B2_53900 [Babesia caballi]
MPLSAEDRRRVRHLPLHPFGSLPRFSTATASLQGSEGRCSQTSLSRYGAGELLSLADLVRRAARLLAPSSVDCLATPQIRLQPAQRAFRVRVPCLREQPQRVVARPHPRARVGEQLHHRRLRELVFHRVVPPRHVQPDPDER